jgi:hypothetical protein
MIASPSDSLGARVRWAVGLVIAGALVAASLHAWGRASRTSFDPPPGHERWAAVSDAAGAYRALRAAGVRGRRVVFLTGRWSRPRSLWERPMAGEQLDALIARERTEVDSDSALFAAARDGIFRSFDVVMPPAALAKHLAEVAGRKELVRLEGGFSLPYDALERRFTRPDSLVAPLEPVVVVLEPSFFQDGAPARVADWLADRETRFDLAFIALDDAEATDAQRDVARALAASVHAVALEGAR